MSDNTIKIEVNGVELEARPGEMLIAVTDRAGVYVPRFCYHEKLSVAANCRMCLVEVEKAPKPLPACATPVTPGMKVFTKSTKAIGAQKATMEFLLINHPLDCPICDQGGECELQDLAMGFGRDIARFAERKRVVADKDIGPLVSTDMTRCIHCTRCVRFGQEIAGIQELGTIGRGERMQISTFIETSVDHELSGNIIDLCPVGALNSKPYRFSARAWEMQALPTVASHDCLGSNVYAHVLLGKVKRVVPRGNEAINETWLADRDRFSYEGIYAPDRLQRPMVRTAGQWREVGWEEALRVAADGLRAAGAGTAALVSPSATVEEGYLLQRLLRHLGAGDIDHRLRRIDFRGQADEPAVPGLGMPIADVEQCDAIVIVGSDLRREVPLLAHRVRKAALRGARVALVASPGEYLFPVAANLAAGSDTGSTVAALGRAAAAGDLLRGASRGLVLFGLAAGRHPRRAELHAAAAALAAATGAKFAELTEGANSAGLALAGVLPHRGPAGLPVFTRGRPAAAIAAAPGQALVLLNVEAEDLAGGAAALDQAGLIVALSPYRQELPGAGPAVLLPVGTFAETAGTYVNVAGTWQSFHGVAAPVGESRPAWKVLRVLGNLLEVPGCDYASAEAVLAELRSLAEAAAAATLGQDGPDAVESAPPAGTGPAVVPMYATDSIVRRAASLQCTAEALRAVPAGQLRTGLG
jgi:NADH-quinone oxidoreductase subunit G